MATLEWVRDNYDASHNRLIEESERDKAVNDWGMGHISMTDATAVMSAYNNQTLLPEYGFHILSTDVISKFNVPTGATLEVDGVEVI